MTQEKIDSIRERMCDEYCIVTSYPKGMMDIICAKCPLDELEASE